jgi:transcriptional regulator with XRE-family HTH domain
MVRERLRGVTMSDGDASQSLPRGKPAFEQDPHRVREISERNLEAAIGREVRTFRRQQGMTVADLANVTGLSIGMLSKIENGNTSPSLTTLQVLSHAFSVPVTAFFRSYEERREAQHVKAGDHLEIERRGTRAGHQYHLLGHIGSNGSGVVVEPYMITLSTESDTFPTFQHGGLELLFMLEGEVDYRHGDQVYALKPGDSLFFDADAPHGPDELVKLPARYLSIISYPRGDRS